jgi:hypothetical protein
MLALTGAVAPGAVISLTLVGSSQDNPFIVPLGKVFVLTDIIISPQVFSSTGEYLFQVIPSPEFLTTGLTVRSRVAEPSSFQVHLMTGMVFKPGSNVRVFLCFGDHSVNVSAFGHLAI